MHASYVFWFLVKHQYSESIHKHVIACLKIASYHTLWSRQDAAQRAVEELNGFKLGNHELVVSATKPKRIKQAPTSKPAQVD